MFKKYQHIERLGTNEVEGIESGDVYFFPKLDGTNGVVWFHEKVRCGSRNRELSLGDDNQGFMAHIMENEPIKRLVEEVGCYVYGEWLVPHTFRGYRDDAWRKFYVFDILIQGASLPYTAQKTLADDYGFNLIPPLLLIENPTEDDVQSCLQKNTYLCKDGEIGEGIVLKNYEFTNKYGRKTWAKVVRNEFKDSHRSNEGCPRIERNPVEEQIAAKFLSEHFVKKEFEKLKEAKYGWSSKFIPELLGRLWHEFLREEAFNFIQGFKNPTINFKRLQAAVNGRIKSILTEVF